MMQMFGCGGDSVTCHTSSSLLEKFDTVKFDRIEKSAVASSSCAGLQPPNDLINESLRWQSVPGSGADSYVFSAFYDRRWNPTVLLIVGVVSEYQQHQDGPRQRYCRMWFRGESKSRLVTAAFRIVPENHGRQFSAGFYTCPVNGTDSPPYAVSLVSNCSDATTNLLKVVDTGSVDNVNYTKNDSINRRPGTFASQKVRYTVCLALLHSNYSDYKRFIETVELNRMFGARRIIVYVQSTSPDVQLVLDSYSRDGVVETIPWDSLPLTSWTENMNSNDRTMQIHYFGQVAALNDCLYRSLSRSTFVVFTDVDEVVVPRNVTVKTEEAWTEMLEQATHDWLASGSAKFGSFPGVYMIKNVFFSFNLTQRFSNNGSTLNDWLLQSSKVDTDCKTVVYRERYIYPYNERSKYFVWSKAAVMVGIHFPYETIDDDNVQTVYVDERRGLLHHYKVLNVSSNDKDKKYVEDKWADQYSDFLSDRIEARRRAIKIDLKS